MTGFTFWKSYYEAGKELTKKQRVELYDAIIEYAFSETEPNFTGILKAVFSGIKPGLDASIKKSKAMQIRKEKESKEGHSPKGHSSKGHSPIGDSPIGDSSKGHSSEGDSPIGHSPMNEGIDIDTDIVIDRDIDININIPPTPSKEGDPPKVEEMGYSPELSETVKDWLSYKKEKRQNYKPTGLKTLLTQIKQHADKYGDKAVIDLIRESMSSNYQGIIFDRLSKARAAPAKQNFTQRTYDYDALEKKLLNGG